MKKFEERLKSLGITLLILSVTVLAACSGKGGAYGGVGY
jgi:hypothetical protein